MPVDALKNACTADEYFSRPLVIRWLSTACPPPSLPSPQAAPACPSSFPHLFGRKNTIRCLIPHAIDQVGQI